MDFPTFQPSKGIIRRLLTEHPEGLTEPELVSLSDGQLIRGTVGVHLMRMEEAKEVERVPIGAAPNGHRERYKWKLTGRADRGVTGS